MQASSSTASSDVADVLARDLGVFMQSLLRPTHRELFATIERAGLSITQVKCLQTLCEADSALSLGSVSDQLGVSLPTTSRAIDGLVRRGQVKRAEDPRDRRAKLITVSSRGRRTYENLVELRMAGIRRFVDALDPQEQESLGAALSPVIERLSR